ncbi:endonuclease/exonuclease/phosphatase family protein [Psychromonas hadalis]|uniref:endonuclease/exonuclease/phosphatase family protein n=1 Tax=Psychromonas hadalis TaxID=211669 RepID=UPI0003B4412C|nr:endonuclease/exonuclease/phosphatase family protein [Psychromonas hadalis]
MVKLRAKTVLNVCIYSIQLLVLALLLLPLFAVELWWVDNLANLQWQWSLCAILLIIINIAFKLRFRYLSITVLSMTIIYQQWFLLYQPQHSPFLDKQTLTIAQFNISYSNPYLNELLPQFGDPDFDILVLQEASDKQDINILSQYYPYSFGLEPLNASPSGLLIFSRWPIIESHSHVLTTAKTHILEVIIQSPKQQIPVQIYAIHPASPRSKILWQQRNKAFDDLAQLVNNSLLNNKIIIGDFNSSHWTPAFSRLQQATLLKNSAAGFGYIPSWSYHQYHVFWPILSAYVDHCLVSQHIAVINKQLQMMPGSDHLLIKTTLAIP